MTPGKRAGLFLAGRRAPETDVGEAGAAFRKTASRKRRGRKTCLRGARDTFQRRAVRITKSAPYVFSENSGSPDRRDKKAGRKGVRSAVKSVGRESRLRTDPRSS